jgi:hypothetical protein
MDQTPMSQELTPAACLARLPEPKLDLEADNPADELRRVELRRSILMISELDHVSEIVLVEAVISAFRQGGAPR